MRPELKEECWEMGKSRKTATGDAVEKEVLRRRKKERLRENKGKREEGTKKTEQTEGLLTDSWSETNGGNLR